MYGATRAPGASGRSAWGYDEGGDGGAAARRHVDERLGGEAGETAVYAVATEDKGGGVLDAVMDLYAAIEQAGVWLTGHGDTLLYDEGRRERCGDGGIPGGGVRLPAEDDPLAAVFVVRLEHQALTVRTDEWDEIHLGAGVGGVALLDAAGPGDVRGDGVGFFGAEEEGVAL